MNKLNDGTKHDIFFWMFYYYEYNICSMIYGCWLNFICDNKIKE